MERAPGVAWQFAVTRNAVFVVWHLFPINWALAACQAITFEVEHIGYVVSGAASFPVAQRLLREHAGDYHAVLVDHKLRGQVV